MLMLFFLKQEQRMSAANENDIRSVEEKEASETLSLEKSTVLEKAYVIQLGAFQEEANADNFLQQMEDLALPALKWEEDGRYFIYSTIYRTEEAANRRISQLEADEILAYVKEWTIPITVEEDDEGVIQAFLETWTGTLHIYENEQKFTKQEWEGFLEDKGPPLSTKGEQFQQVIREKVEALDDGKRREVQYEQFYLESFAELANAFMQ